MKKLFALSLAVFLIGCASVPRPSLTTFATTGQASAPPYDAWARVLEKYVDNEGRIDFSGIANDRSDLDRFVAYVYDIGPNNRPELFPTAQQTLAFHINAYNALAMHKVIETGIPESLAGMKKITFFALGKVRVGGMDISLYDYENNVIRALGDPRIHVALNCMSVSCPRLPRDVFLAEKLEVQLDREARKFFAEARNVSVNDTNKVLTLSEILKFFTGDFLAVAPSLAAYVNRYRNPKIAEDYRVEFFDYDWTINRQPRK